MPDLRKLILTCIIFMNVPPKYTKPRFSKDCIPQRNPFPGETSPCKTWNECLSEGFRSVYIYSCYLCRTLNLLKSVSFAIYILLLFVPDFKFVEECFLRYIYTSVICARL